MLNIVSKTKFNMLILLDSEVSDYCFINKELFITLTLLCQLTMGLVAYIPKLRSNLISVSRLVKKSIKVEFNKYKA